MARTFESATLQIDPSLQISKNVNFDPRAIALLRTFPKYQKRLASFNATKWHSKPPALSPPFCALYGWHVLEPDVLKCDDCDEVLYAHLPQRNSEEYPGRIDNIITRLVAQHTDLCGFRAKHEPFEFFKRDDSAYLFKNRLLSFPKSGLLPEVTSSISADSLAKLVAHYGSFVDNKDQMETIISLAVNGWNFQKSVENPMGNLECEDDTRVIPVRWETIYLYFKTL